MTRDVLTWNTWNWARAERGHNFRTAADKGTWQSGPKDLNNLR